MIFQSIKEVFLNLNKSDKIRIFKLFIIMIITAILEMSYIYLIFQFISFLSLGRNFFDENSILNFFDIEKFINYSSFSNFSFLVIICVLLAQLFIIFNTHLTTRYSFKIGLNISRKLYHYYLQRDYIIHLKSSLSDMINKIDDQVTRVVTMLIMPVLNILAKIILIIPILILSFSYNLKISTIIFLTLFIFYFLFFILFKRVIYNKSYVVGLLTKQRYKLMDQTFSLLREIKIYNIVISFSNKFTEIGTKITKTYTFLATIRSFPRSIIEVLAISFFVVLVNFFFEFSKENFNELIVFAGAFFFILYKLLPSFQTIYLNFSQLKSGAPAYSIIRDDFLNSLKININSQDKESKEYNNFDSLELSNISFGYNEKEKILENLNLKIKKSQIIGIAGISGSGKTTLINIILGLLKPERGQIKVNNLIVSKTSDLQDYNFAFVPQDPIIIDGSFLDNITLKNNNSVIDNIKLKQSIDFGNLNKIKENFLDNMGQLIGENGITLSGGQKQRLAIARAIYKNPKLLILDEATSSLDSISEQEILENVRKNKNKVCTIIISHNLQSLKICDQIIFLEKSKIISTGTFEDLYAKHENFKSLINVSKSDI